MTRMDDFEAGLVAQVGSEHETSTGGQENSQVRLTHRDDGSFVTSDSSLDDGVLETLGLSEERLARLRHLRAEIAGGRYFVASHDVAGRLMDYMSVD
jgi:anti-sigma28 factor (negative regulator of flagellin synthesis)